MDFANGVAEAFHTFEPEEVRQCLKLDLESMGAEEAERQFAEAERVLEELMHVFDDRVGVYMALTEGKLIAREAKERARSYA